MNQKYRVRLSDPLAARVQALATAWGLPLSKLLRLAILDMTNNPERIPGLMVYPHSSGQVEDSTSTPEQMAAAVDYLEGLTGFDLSDICQEERVEGTN